MNAHKFAGMLSGKRYPEEHLQSLNKHSLCTLIKLGKKYGGENVNKWRKGSRGSNFSSINDEDKAALEQILAEFRLISITHKDKAPIRTTFTDVDKQSETFCELGATWKNLFGMKEAIGAFALGTSLWVALHDYPLEPAAGDAEKYNRTQELLSTFSSLYEKPEDYTSSLQRYRAFIHQSTVSIHSHLLFTCLVARRIGICA